MPRWTETDIPDLRGRRALVTGAASGIGFDTASTLARRGAEVLIVDRNVAGGEAAVAAIHALAPQAQVSFAPLDLGSLAAIRQFCDARLHEGLPLDILVNNAGLLPPLTRQVTADGFELKFGVNYLGHFALTGLLLPLLLRGNRARVVSVSSIVQRMGQIDFDDLQAERSYEPQRAYNQAKLACLIFALELQRRADAKLLSVAAHPGVARTGIGSSREGQKRQGLHDYATDLAFNLTMKLFGQSSALGALSLLYAAISPDVEAGGFYGPDGWFEMRGYPKPVRPSPRALDPATARRLWEVSEQLTGVRYSAL